MPVHSLEGQRVVVLGGSSGIGFAVAERAIREGAQVVVGSSSAARVEDSVKRLGPAASGARKKTANGSTAASHRSCASHASHRDSTRNA